MAATENPKRISLRQPAPCEACQPGADNGCRPGPNCKVARLAAAVMLALALPGVAQAESPPERAFVAFRYMNYQDSQPGAKRLQVDTPAVQVVSSLGAQWGVDATLVADKASGATPSRHSDMSATSVIDGEHAAAEIKLTYYRPRASYTLGVSDSLGYDCTSNGLSLGANWVSDNQNTTWRVGYGLARDRIDPSDGGVLGTVSNQKRKSNAILLGLTQVMSRVDVIDLNFTRSSHRGYLNDPYKESDLRPDYRTQTALLGRWNYHFTDLGATLRSSYRFYVDSYDIRAHAVQMEWVQPFGRGLTASPLLRYYTQSKARFYSEAPYDAAAAIGVENSYDQRLSSFGAITAGLKLAYPWRAWTFDGRAELYQQRTAWARGGGAKSTGLAPLNARLLQVGVARSF